MPRLSTTMPTMAKDNSVGVVVPVVDASHPTKLMSVTTIIPCQNLRYTSCSLMRSSSDTVPQVRYVVAARIH